MNVNVQNELIAILNGLYTLQRSIDQPSVFIEGKAIFCHQPDNCIYYQEEGTYFLNDIQYSFYQQRYFIFKDNNLNIINFQQKLLHKVCLSDVKQPLYRFTNAHLCGEDSYFLDFYIRKKCINMNYKVLGPNKDYSIATVLRKNHV